ncbi:ABC transporter permease [Hymenobacter sp. BT770]|uniref:ABC transporter permease n=1 Tax=Hymenobacter sp. BT770 TaxID=2886942 RepID=UPI001D129973|nr:ABC transporter permease [Hymenobacter sp. BT770]MCC3151785.1 ABC transporter permease [Hymenobacter sp. BT770]MDO3413593.1 ABC transporter permease [Hymenobacter sp. BT770]
MAILAPTSSSWSQKLAMLWLGLVGLTALLAAALPLPYAPGVPDLAHVAEPPFGAGAHWLGTDALGRDVLSMLVFGARTAVLLTLPAAVLSTLLGALAGGAAGFWGNKARLAVPYWLLAGAGAWWAVRFPGVGVGLAVAAISLGWLFTSWWRKRELASWPVPVNSVVMGAATTLDTIPRLVLVVAVTAGTGVSVSGLLVLLTLTSWPHSARLVRAQMLRVRTLPFVEAAQAVGAPAYKVWLHHALPHALQPLRTALPLSIAGLLGLESTLSFLGIGLPPDVASWGRLMATVRSEPGAWWTFLFPTMCLIISMISLSSISQYRPSAASS